MPGDTERNAFRDALLAVTRCRPLERARSLRALALPNCPPRFIRQFGLKCLAGAVRFPGQLAALYEIAENPAAKLLLLENLLEESGLHVKAGWGVELYPESRHVPWLERFVRAAGAGDEEIAAVSRSALQAGASPWFEAAVKERRWAEAMGYLLAGQEANCPAFAKAALSALRAKGFSDSELVFFIAHIEADEKHGRQAVDVLAALPLDAAQRRAVAAAAQRGADDWWALFNGDKPAGVPAADD
jgi:pyrroloquinoline quinone (PQQ) biosynthesis protein C